MPTITMTIRSVATMTMVQAGFVLVSGWLSVAMAGGGRWTG